MTDFLKSTMLAAAITCAAVITGGAASAASLTYDSWTDTDAPSISPVVTITDEGSSVFLVDIALEAGSLTGSILAMFFDVGANYGDMSVTDGSYDPSSITSTSGVVAPSSVGSNENLNGVPAAITDLFDFALEFAMNDAVGTNALSFKLTDANDALALSDFNYLGLRVQQVGPNGEDSDKLVATSTPVVPLPAAGWLLLGGIGGIAALKRRKKKASS